MECERNPDKENLQYLELQLCDILTYKYQGIHSTNFAPPSSPYPSPSPPAQTVGLLWP